MPFVLELFIAGTLCAFLLVLTLLSILMCLWLVEAIQYRIKSRG